MVAIISNLSSRFFVRVESIIGPVCRGHFVGSARISHGSFKDTIINFNIHIGYYNVPSNPVQSIGRMYAVAGSNANDYIWKQGRSGATSTIGHSRPDHASGKHSNTNAG
jgi:hypothetical protein